MPLPNMSVRAARKQHIAIQEALDGRRADWLEKVSDEQYLSGPDSP